MHCVACDSANASATSWCLGTVHYHKDKWLSSQERDGFGHVEENQGLFVARFSQWRGRKPSKQGSTFQNGGYSRLSSKAHTPIETCIPFMPDIMPPAAWNEERRAGRGKQLGIQSIAVSSRSNGVWNRLWQWPMARNG
jgi:hypothetical protein